jgi:hypothetical protein
MTTRNKKFVADLKAFSDLTTKQMEDIAVESIQDVLEGAQSTARGISAGGALIKGRIPVVSGDLVNSLLSEVQDRGGGQTAIGAASYSLVLAGYQLGDVLRFTWTQAYAMRMEVGFKSFPGWHFVGYNAAQWGDIVERKAKMVRARNA